MNNRDQYIYINLYCSYKFIGIYYVSNFHFQLLNTLLFTFSSWIWGLNKDMGSAVTIANERTSIRSVVKWLIPSSEWASAKFSNDIFLYLLFSYFILFYFINIYNVVKIIAQHNNIFCNSLLPHKYSLLFTFFKYGC